MSDAATVFIVDDDASVRTSLKRLMKSAGYSALTFASAKEFLAHEIKHKTPACLILDVKMPGKNGLDLQQELAQRENSIPIVFISGHGDIPTSVKAMKKGAVDFIPKPYDDEELLTAVRGALEHDLKINEAASEKEKILQRFEKLTAREYEIMTFVISGMLNKQIAAALGISEKTVKVHRARVYEKTGVVSLAELVRLTEQVGIQPVKT